MADKSASYSKISAIFMEYQLEKLNNGITVLKVPKRESDSVMVNFFIKTGSRNEIAKQRGISHFLEHLLFKGTKKYPNAKLLSSTVEAIGADYNAATNKEYTVFYIKAASKHLPLIFDVLSDMLQQPLLDPVEIEREKGVIVEEMNMYRDTPMRYVAELLEQQLWPHSDIGAQIIGDEKTVGGISRADLAEYIGRKYVNENLIVGIAGKFDERQLRRLIKSYWRQGVNGQQNAYAAAPKSGKSQAVTIHEKKTEQAHLALGFYSFDYNDPSNYVLAVLSNILGGGMSSRLFSEIRERRGLAYYVRMGSSHYLDTGLTAITAGLKLGKLEEAIAVIAAELGKIKKSKVGKAELVKAKENIKGHMTLSLEDPETRLEWYLEQVAFHRKILTPKEVFRKIDGITPAQLQQLARRLFRKDKFRLAVIGPYAGKEQKFLKLLKL